MGWARHPAFGTQKMAPVLLPAGSVTLPFSAGIVRRSQYLLLEDVYGYLYIVLRHIYETKRRDLASRLSRGPMTAVMKTIHNLGSGYSILTEEFAK